MERSDFRKYSAELVGSFAFFTIGYFSVPAFGLASPPGAPNLLVVPFSFGLGLLAAIFAFGHISGGHYNPAVTIAMVLDRRTDPRDAVGYIVSQIVGAIAAGIVVMVALNQAAVKAGITAPGQGVSDIGALIIETVSTAVFLAVILASTKRVPSLAALAIPLTLVAIHFSIATLSGASVNPARSLGSAIVGGDLSKIWIYLVGPIAGGIDRLGRVAARRRRGRDPAGRAAEFRNGCIALRVGTSVGRSYEWWAEAPIPQLGQVSRTSTAGILRSLPAPSRRRCATASPKAGRHERRPGSSGGPQQHDRRLVDDARDAAHGAVEVIIGRVERDRLVAHRAVHEAHRAAPRHRPERTSGVRHATHLEPVL